MHRTPSPWADWRTRLRNLKHDIPALYMAYLDARTPWPAKLLTLTVLAYALSPLDLIPDFIPVLGYLDDLLLLPLGVWWALRLIPPEVMDDARAAARRHGPIHSGLGLLGAAVVVGLYLAALLWLWTAFRRAPAA